MLTRRQRLVVVLWVGVPFALLLAIMVINPAYGSHIFERIGPLSGLTLMLFLQIINALALVFGLRAINRWAARRDETAQSAPRVVAVLLALVTLLLCTLPSIWLALLYPSVIILLDAPGF